MSERHFYSVEYLDGDGDPVIEHGFMTERQAGELMGQFVERGIVASVNRLSGHRDGAVISPDVEGLLDVGRADPGDLG